MFLADRISLDSKRNYTDEGYLIVPSRIARTGIQEYYASEMGLTDRDPKDIIKVYRPPEEVFKESSLASFSNKPVTNDHPPVLVDASNFKEYSVGFSSSEVFQSGDYVETILTVMDSTTIEDIKSGKAELSNGYISDIEWVEGVTPEGEQYDCFQKDIIGNHIAIVKQGRAGYSCRVADKSPIEDKSMPTIVIDGVTYEATEQTAQAVSKLQTRLTDAEKEVTEKEDELKKKEDELEEAKAEAKKSEDSLKARLDAAKADIPDAAALDALVDTRQAIVSDALRISPEFKWQGKDSATIRREIVTDKCTNVAEDASDDYIAARFDALLDSSPDNTLDSALANQTKGKTTDSNTTSIVDEARDKFAKSQRNAWNKKGE